MTRRVILHYHIYKNAGTTMGRMIKSRLMLWPPGHVLHHGQVLGYYYLDRATRQARQPYAVPVKSPWSMSKRHRPSCGVAVVRRAEPRIRQVVVAERKVELTKQPLDERVGIGDGLVRAQRLDALGARTREQQQEPELAQRRR